MMVPAILLFIILLFIYKARKKIKRKQDNTLIGSYNRNSRISYPKAKHANGTKKTEQERKEDMDLYFEKVNARGRMHAKAEEIRQTQIGITHYIWRSAEDGDCCSECKKNNGKKFAWKRPAKTGHPGEGKCCPNGVCRCYPEAIIK
ncbi:hypothetical protein [Hafnia psychrotolerans]|nr:hypothetical protein [Hafnia psychrotolerans]